MSAFLWGKLQSLVLSDEEMGKKDDDHKPSRGGLRPQSWHLAPRLPPRKGFRRLLFALLVAAALYLFITNIPTDLPIRDRRRPVYEPPEGGSNRFLKQQGFSAPVSSSSPQRQAPALDILPEGEYDGPVKLVFLGLSLYAITSTGGIREANKNVLFIASGLKSATKLLPMACQMGEELRSYVHFALMSRSDISMEELKSVNGIDESCQVIFHDARPDHAPESTPVRFQLAVGRAMYNINTHMHPQAVIIDGSDDEESLFLEAIRQHGSALGKTMIEIPEGGAQRLAWLTKLDSSSLSAWERISFDILIHASTGSSGSLIRLLKTLSQADFSGGPVPHLTVELPSSVDPQLMDFLESFQWPPYGTNYPSKVQLLTLKHRILRNVRSEEESSVRFLESFWPPNAHAHVLVLSPQAELSPNFLHYLKYALLEYRYSKGAYFQGWDQRLFGISLDLPSTYLDGSGPFKPPSSAPTKDTSSVSSLPSPAPPFLWQAPSSNAVLFLGEKWVELHSFVSHSLEAQDALQSLPPLLSEKAVSRKYPSWLEFVARLCQARGYWTLYPSRDISAGLATIHNEQYHPPEEYETDLREEAGKDEEGNQEEEEVVLVYGAMLDHLPGDGHLPPFRDLPLLALNGVKTELADLDQSAAEYAREFRVQVGGCSPDKSEGVALLKTAQDLFCLGDY